MTMSRRQFVGSVAGAGIASLTAPRRLSAQTGEPIRIGLLAAKTGRLASGGIDMELALTMFLRERENTLAGRRVELIVADTAGVPATARIKAQELVEKNNVHCIIGPLAAFEALAIAEGLRLHVRSLRPDWPSDAERLADAEVHARVSASLRLAR